MLNRTEVDIAMRFLYRISADIVFTLHLILVAFILFGWAFDSLWHVYMTVLTVTLLSDLVFGYCVISKWEFYLRRKVNPQLDYNYTWTTFYTRTLTQGKISEVFFKRAAVFFLLSSLLLSIYFHFFFV